MLCQEDSRSLMAMARAHRHTFPAFHALPGAQHPLLALAPHKMERFLREKGNEILPFPCTLATGERRWEGPQSVLRASCVARGQEHVQHVGAVQALAA